MLKTSYRIMPKKQYKRKPTCNAFLQTPGLSELYEEQKSDVHLTPFHQVGDSQRRNHRRKMEKMLNESKDIKNLIKFLATISLCLG